MKKAFLFLLAALLVLAAAPAAQACCIYNHSYNTVFVDGPQIYNNVTPAGHHCTRGKGGKYEIQAIKKYDVALTPVTGIKVDDHGWITVFARKGDRWKMVAKDRHGKVTSVKYLKKWNTDYPASPSRNSPPQKKRLPRGGAIPLFQAAPFIRSRLMSPAIIFPKITQFPPLTMTRL